MLCYYINTRFKVAPGRSFRTLGPINNNDCYHGRDTVIAIPYDEKRASGTIFTSAPIAYPGIYAVNGIMQITGAEKAISKSNAKLIVTN